MRAAAQCNRHNYNGDNGLQNVFDAKPSSRTNSMGHLNHPPAPAPWPQLIRAWGTWEREVRREWRRLVASVGLSDQQWLLLWFAGEAAAPGRPQTDLADDLNVSPAQACLLLEDLRQRALLSATRCPPDRRRQYWQPTEAGRQLLAECDEQLRAWQAAHLPGDCAAHLEAIRKMLAAITPVVASASPAIVKEVA